MPSPSPRCLPRFLLFLYLQVVPGSYVAPVRHIFQILVLLFQFLESAFKTVIILLFQVCLKELYSIFNLFHFDLQLIRVLLEIIKFWWYELRTQFKFINVFLTALISDFISSTRNCSVERYERSWISIISRMISKVICSWLSPPMVKYLFHINRELTDF